MTISRGNNVTLSPRWGRRNGMPRFLKNLSFLYQSWVDLSSSGLFLFTYSRTILACAGVTQRLIWTSPASAFFFGVALKLAGRWLCVCHRSWGCPKWGDGPHMVHIDCSTCKIVPQAAQPDTLAGGDLTQARYAPHSDLPAKTTALQTARYGVTPLVRSVIFVSASANDA